MDLAANLTSSGSFSGSLLPSERRGSMLGTTLTVKDVDRLCKEDGLFQSVVHGGSLRDPTRGRGVLNDLIQTKGPISTAPALPPAAAARAAAAAFGATGTTGLGRPASRGTNSSVQLVGNAAQVAAKQRRASITIPDGMSQGDIMSR